MAAAWRRRTRSSERILCACLGCYTNTPTLVQHLVTGWKYADCLPVLPAWRLVERASPVDLFP